MIIGKTKVQIRRTDINITDQDYDIDTNINVLSYYIEQKTPLKTGIGSSSNSCNMFAQMLSLFAI